MKDKTSNVLVKAACALAACALGLTSRCENLETARLQAEIDRASAQGGGRVVVTRGVHRTGTLYLKSGVDLHLEEGAVLLGGDASRYYDDAIPGREVYGYPGMHTNTVTRKAFIYAENATNIAITGKGVIDSQGQKFFDHNTVLWKRFWAKPPCMRPRMVVFMHCRGIRLEDATFKDCPVWTMWLRDCEDITVSRIRVIAELKMINSDGIDFDGCRRIRVGDSYFSTGDDCLVLRSIRRPYHSPAEIVTEDVVVSNCVLHTACQGVRIGCPSDETVRNAVFRDITFTGYNAIGSEQPSHYLERGNKGRLITSNILFENWKVTCDGHPLEAFVENGLKMRDFGHMTFRNFEVCAKMPFVVRGNPASPIVGMRFENVSGTVDGERPFDVQHAPGIVFENVTVKGRTAAKASL